jgi:S-adenosylmethionine-diacylglycerol 3-amino-3-carboxypropyl transferase
MMTTAADALTAQRLTRRNLDAAVHRHSAFSRQGLNERLFTWAFGSLVYPQIWEDPLVDMQALDIRGDDHVVAIASGGCNVMSYLAAEPARITAVDLNAAHVALLHLKLAAFQVLDDHADVLSLFGAADEPRNVAIFDSKIAPALPVAARRYWEGRDLAGRRRIAGFARGFYRSGQLGRFIRAAWLLARLHGVRPQDLLDAADITAQRRFFDEKLAPLFRAPLVRALVSRRASLIGLGIPPRQYDALCDGQAGGMADVLCARLRKLVCDFSIAENYFARQAFGLSYGDGPACVPPYLDPAHFEHIRSGARRVDVVHGSITAALAAMPAGGASCFVLLDAQDWMDDATLNSLWREITRVARPGSRALFRTAADAPLLEGRLAPAILARWRGDASRDRELTRADRAAIYGRVHLLTLED